MFTWSEIDTIWFPNFDRIQIIIGFRKSCEYKYKYIRFSKIIRIQIQILFGFKMSAEYKYEYHCSQSNIQILFEYRINRSPLRQNSGENQNYKN